MAEAERGVEPAGTPAARCRSVGFRYAGEGDDRECEDEYAHGRVQGRVGAGDGACRRFVSHEVAYEYGCQRRAERVEGRAELNELVAPFFVAAERFQHGIHHGVEHAHREARNEGSGEVDAVASRTPCEPHDAYACEAYCDGRQSGLFVPHPLEHHARRNAHERIGDEVGQVAELGLEVRGGELRFDDDAHRILQARDESYDEEQGEHHSDGQCTVVVSFCHVGMGLRVRPLAPAGVSVLYRDAAPRAGFFSASGTGPKGTAASPAGGRRPSVFRLRGGRACPSGSYRSGERAAYFVPYPPVVGIICGFPAGSVLRRGFPAPKVAISGILSNFVYLSGGACTMVLFSLRGEKRHAKAWFTRRFIIINYILDFQRFDTIV